MMWLNWIEELNVPLIEVWLAIVRAGYCHRTSPIGSYGPRASPRGQDSKKTRRQTVGKSVGSSFYSLFETVCHEDLEWKNERWCFGVFIRPTGVQLMFDRRRLSEHQNFAVYSLALQKMFAEYGQMRAAKSTPGSRGLILLIWTQLTNSAQRRPDNKHRNVQKNEGWQTTSGPLKSCL